MIALPEEDKNQQPRIQKRPVEDIDLTSNRRKAQMDPSGKPLKILKKVDGIYFLFTYALGKGSFGTTLLCCHNDSEDYLACKVTTQIQKKMIDKCSIMKKRSKMIIMFQERLQAEVDTWKKMDHPNIVKFKDFRESDNFLYMFMEYCVCTLEQKLKPPQMKISEQRAINYFKQIANGCHYLYMQNVVHRDLKPSNILIHKDGTVRIADFGFAKFMDEEMKDTQIDQTGQIGTIVYMSPQVYERKPYSIKTDVWSLGIIFYEVLVGRTPDSFLCSSQGYLQVDSTTLVFPPVFFKQLMIKTVKISIEMKDLIRNMLVRDEQGRLSISEIVEKLEQKEQQLKLSLKQDEDAQIIS